MGFEELEEVPRLANGKVNKKALPKPKERTDNAETVMELDSLGQMRKFTRKAASEDRVLDNVRAILIGIILQSHAIPLLPNSAAMLSAKWEQLAHLGVPRSYSFCACCAVEVGLRLLSSADSTTRVP